MFDDDDDISDMEIRDQVEVWHLMAQAGMLTFLVPEAETLLNMLHASYQRIPAVDAPIDIEEPSELPALPALPVQEHRVPDWNNMTEFPPLS